MEYTYIIAPLVAMAIVTGLVPYVMKLAYKIGAVDYPCERKVHCKPMPRIGGLAIYFGYIATLLCFVELKSQVIGLMLGSTIIVAVGLIDDKLNISPRKKLLGQIVAATVIVMSGIKMEFISNPFGDPIGLGYFTIPLTIFWIVGVTNAVNLIDGLDGLAAGTSAIAAVVFGVVAFSQGLDNVGFLSLILAASAFGFLKYNFNPAKIFMGDCGSMFLGLNLGALSVIGLAKNVAVLSIFVPIVILGVPIFDTLFAIIRRYQKNEPIFKADKEHLHHCLLNKGLSHKNTVLVIYAINIIMGISAIAVSFLTREEGLMVITALSIFIYLGAQNIGVIALPKLRLFRAQTKKAKNK